MIKTRTNEVMSIFNIADIVNKYPYSVSGDNPYDIPYTQIFGKNKITTPVLDDILSNSRNPLTSFKTIEFISKPYITILNDENLNINLGTHIKVEKGCFISLYQIVKDDGYSHDVSEISSLDIPTKHGIITYKSKGKITKVLFSNILIFTNTHYVILNNKDYQDIIRNITKQCNVGTIKLMNFKDWHKTEDVSMELQSKLERYNKENTKPYYEKYIKSYLFY